MKRFSSGLPAFAAAFLVLAVAVACTPTAARGNASAAVQPGAAPAATPAPTAAPAAETIQHLTPRRDSVGPQPAKFEWTSVKAADTYAMGIWNEVDRMVFRVDGIPGTSYEPPKELELEPGTYFWTVTAVHDGQEIASSGLAAFVVRTAP